MSKMSFLYFKISRAKKKYLLFFVLASAFATYKISISNLLFDANWEPSSGIFNITNFIYILNPGHSICANPNNNSQAKILLILIHSARQYETSRRAIRSSYGSLKYYQDYSTRLVFFMGLYDPRRKLPIEDIAREDKKLQLEHEIYGDTVMGSFVDSYRNLTYKQAMALTWATMFCPDASWILKADDDIFLDLRKLINMRKMDTALSKPPAFYCNIIPKDSEPEREGKWKVTWIEYPYKYYPQYCYGSVYGVDMDMIRKWMTVYKNVRFFWIDDVYFTGLVRQEAKQVFSLKWNNGLINLWNSYSTNGHYLIYCDKMEWDGTRNFLEIVLTRRSTIENDMKCMWKILELMAANVTLTSNKTVSLYD